MTSPLFKSPIPLNYLDTDTALTANSDVKVPTQKAVKAYADTKLTTVTEANLTLADNTTADASTSKHGFLKKLSNVATEFMNGVGSWVTAVTLDATQTLTNKTLTSPLLQGTVDGWIYANETWTYASATTITVPSGAAARYAKGDKIKIKQTTVKYFYIIAVADTTLTVTGGSDYSVANAAITDNYFSHQSTPTGFPVYFNWTPTLTGGNADFAGYDVARFTIEGTLLRLCFTISNRNLSGTAGTIQITVPVTVGSGGSGAWGVYKMYTAATGYVNARCILGDSGTYMELQKDMTSGTWAGNETGVYIIIDGFYWI